MFSAAFATNLQLKDVTVKGIRQQQGTQFESQYHYPHNNEPANTAKPWRNDRC